MRMFRPRNRWAAVQDCSRREQQEARGENRSWAGHYVMYQVCAPVQRIVVVVCVSGSDNACVVVVAAAQQVLLVCCRCRAEPCCCDANEYDDG